jgi:hypothetical protein
VKILDLVGQKFGKLTVIKLVNPESNTGYKKYECVCECGGKITTSTNSLRKGRSTTCGCSRLNIFKRLKPYLVENTLLPNLTNKTRVTSTTGVKGVTITNSEKYRARIKFKSKEYHLGVFDTLEEAAKSRKVAEDKYFKPILEKYSKKR